MVEYSAAFEVNKAWEATLYNHIHAPSFLCFFPIYFSKGGLTDSKNDSLLTITVKDR